MRKRKKRGGPGPLVLRLLAVCVVLTVLGIVGVLGVNFYMIDKVDGRILSDEEVSFLKDADCILILGAGVKEDGSPSLMLRDRLDKGISLYEMGVSDRLLMSGDHGQTGYDEVNTMKNYAMERNISDEHVFMDHAGFSTYESMYRARAVFQADKVVIVTQKYHMYRALYLAEGLGLNAYGVCAEDIHYSGMLYFKFREMIARVKDFFTMQMEPEPTYLGDVIPISGSGVLTNDGKTISREGGN